MLEHDSRTPNRLKMTLEREKYILLLRQRFGDTILHGGHGIRDQLQNPAHDDGLQEGMDKFLEII